MNELRKRIALFALVAVSATSVTPGCAMMTMNTPPPPPYAAPPDCTTNNVPAVIDLGGAAILGSIAPAFLLLGMSGPLPRDPDMPEVEPPSPESFLLTGAIFLAGAGLFAYSGINGIRASRACRRAEGEWQQQLLLQRPPPPPPPALPPPQQFPAQ